MFYDAITDNALQTIITDMCTTQHVRTWTTNELYDAYCGLGGMLSRMVLCCKIYACAHITFIFIIILDHKNVVVDTTFISILCMLSEILIKVVFLNNGACGNHSP